MIESIAKRGGTRRGGIGASIVAPSCCARTTTAAETHVCAPETAARLEWLTSHLGAHAGTTDLWWKGWLGVHATGAAVEAMLWSHPRAAADDAEEYERRFGGGRRVTWSIVSFGAGARLQATF